MGERRTMRRCIMAASKNENDINEKRFSGGVKKLYKIHACICALASNFLIALSRQQECASKINGVKRALALCEACVRNS